MGKTEAQTLLNNSKYALDHLYKAIDHYYKILKRAETSLGDIKEAQESLSGLFVDRDQWSPNANHYHRQFVERMKALDEKKEVAALPHDERIDHFLSEIGSTSESLSCLAGTVLQLAKQTLTLAYQTKANIPTAICVGTQSLSEIIWEGRNHSMHWEEGNPRPPMIQMFTNLSNDFGITLNQGENNSLSILGAIDWTSPERVIDDLNTLLQ